MKNTLAKKIERRVNIIAADLLAGNTKNIVRKHLSDLSETGRQRVLLHLVYRGLRTGDLVVVQVPLQILRISEEAALPFIFAAAYSERGVAMVPDLVFKFCRNTTIARHELKHAAFKLIHMVEQQMIIEYLGKAFECLRLCDQKIQPLRSSGETVCFIAKRLCIVAKKIKRRAGHETEAQKVLDGVRSLVNSDQAWNIIDSATE